MAIKDPILFITVEEFKNSKYFNELLFDKVTTPDNEIWFAISVASSNIDYLSGFTISKKWPEITPTDFTDNIQTATTHYVRFLLTKDVDYLRGQGSISQGGLTYSETNPDDPYFIPPEVFNYLRKIKEYPNIKGFNLKGIEPQKNNWFNKFISNCGEDSPLNAYIPYTNIQSLDSRTKITITHPQNMLRPIVNIDTRGINTSTTVPEFKSPKETIDIKYDKENHVVNSDISNKIIEERIFTNFLNKKITEHLADILNPNNKWKHVEYKYDFHFDEYTDYTLLPKKYADDKLQYKLTAGNNITIKDNIISASGGGNVDEDRIFNNKTDKENATNLVNNVIKIGVTKTTYYNNPFVTDDLDIPDKKYVDDEIIKVKDLIKKLVVWKTIGERIDDRTWSNFSPSLHALYRVFLISETSVPLQNGYKEVIFFTSASAIGTGTYRITSRKIGNSDASLNMIYDNTKWTLKLNGGDTGGAIYRLEELKADDLYEIKSTTLEIKSPEIVDIEKPIKIDSKTLLTKEIRENEWEINLKESPTPTPYPKWKDVAISLSGNSISSYQLKSNTFYKIFYDLNPFSLSTFGKTPTQTIEIFWQPQTSSNWVCFLPSLKRISYINIVNNKLIKLITDQGYLWKLQELQE
ncbi:hypothetical protein [Spiroplasma endosymbiont of Polydrusus pterygomalis]|uniref:hypothetical protein n=1 Tax=Spiroplasma endosymbiont of Polydrusus pterygomalis TaxID=3139327 RepID=UPI003CCAACA6